MREIISRLDSKRQRVRHSSAFSLIEVLLVVVILGVVATMIPRFNLKKLERSVSFILEEINEKVSAALFEATKRKRITRIRFIQEDEQSVVILEEQYRDPEQSKKELYRAIEDSFTSARYELPRTFQLQKVFVGGKERLQDSKDGASLYCIPRGLVQDATVVFFDTYNARDEQVTFKTRPFEGRFEVASELSGET